VREADSLERDRLKERDSRREMIFMDHGEKKRIIDQICM
jgi:hypothetical protein